MQRAYRDTAIKPIICSRGGQEVGNLLISLLLVSLWTQGYVYEKQKVIISSKQLPRDNA